MNRVYKLAVFMFALMLVVSACGGPPAPPAQKAVEPEATKVSAEEAAEVEPAAEAEADLPEGWTAPQNVETAVGETYEVNPDHLSPARDYIYCELVFDYGDAGSDIYSTSPVAPCDLDWWENLDMDAVAEEMGANQAIKNGPQWWAPDTVQELTTEPMEIGGIEMIYGATLPPGTMGTAHYAVFNTAKYQYLIYEAGKPIYQLIDPDGYTYVVQGYKVPQEDLATLGDQMQDLPEGWQYSVVTPSSDLVLNLTPANPIPSVQDEFDQIYIRIPGQEPAVDGEEAGDVPTTDMNAANGETYTLTLKDLTDSRDYIYCELVFDYGDAGQDIYSTSPIAPCNVGWWDNLGMEAVAAELGANSVVKNGPQRWSMDEVSVMASEPMEIAGVSMNFGAVLPAGTTGEGGTPHYQVFTTAKFQYLVYEAGKPTYQLVDPDGYVYIIQGYKVEPDQLATLGSLYQELPEGWQYIVVTPSDDLVLNLTPDAPIPSVQDEFDQIFIRIPGQ